MAWNDVTSRNQKQTAGTCMLDRNTAAAALIIVLCLSTGWLLIGRVVRFGTSASVCCGVCSWHAHRRERGSRSATFSIAKSIGCRRCVGNPSDCRQNSDRKFLLGNLRSKTVFFSSSQKTRLLLCVGMGDFLKEIFDCIRKQPFENDARTVELFTLPARFL